MKKVLDTLEMEKFYWFDFRKFYDDPFVSWTYLVHKIRSVMVQS